MDTGPVLEAEAEAQVEAKPVVAEPHKPKVFTDPSTVKVMLCEPSSGLVDSFIYDNRKDFIMECARLEARSRFKFFTGNTARLHVSYARELMCHEAETAGMDYLFFVDDDMMIPQNCFERLFETMKETKADVAAPICTQRIPPYKPVLYRINVTEKDGQRWIDNQYYDDFEPNSVVFPDAVGFGVVLISMDLIKRIPKPRFFSNTNIGEDIFFCMKARDAAQAKIVADTRIKIGHMGYPKIFTEYDWVKHDKKTEKFKSVYGHLYGTDPDLNIELLNKATSQ